MIEIKFRGQDQEGKWVYGYYCDIAGAEITKLEPPLYSIVDVLRNTVSPSTGLYDVKGKEVYFNDICKYKDDSGTEQIGLVSDYGYFSGYIRAFGGDEEGNQDIELHPDHVIEVIGNLWDDPEIANKYCFVEENGEVVFY